jgi:hypothetical protein
MGRRRRPREEPRSKQMVLPGLGFDELTYEQHVAIHRATLAQFRVSRGTLPWGRGNKSPEREGLTIQDELSADKARRMAKLLATAAHPDTPPAEAAAARKASTVLVDRDVLQSLMDDSKRLKELEAELSRPPENPVPVNKKMAERIRKLELVRNRPGAPISEVTAAIAAIVRITGKAS